MLARRFNTLLILGRILAPAVMALSMWMVFVDLDDGLDRLAVFSGFLAGVNLCLTIFQWHVLKFHKA
jgi:hypothetical protein